MHSKHQKSGLQTAVQQTTMSRFSCCASAACRHFWHDAGRTHETISRRKATRIRHQQGHRFELDADLQPTRSNCLKKKRKKTKCYQQFKMTGSPVQTTSPNSLPPNSCRHHRNHHRRCSPLISLMLQMMAVYTMCSIVMAGEGGAYTSHNSTLARVNSSDVLDGSQLRTSSPTDNANTSATTPAIALSRDDDAQHLLSPSPIPMEPLQTPVEATASVAAIPLRSVQPASQHQQQKLPQPDGTVDDDYYFEDGDDNEYSSLIANKSAKGMYIGAPCEHTCAAKLHHVVCDPGSGTCGCERNYPVVIGKTKGCAKPKKLDDQCLFHETCMHNDPNSMCVQVKHNALCQCVEGFHSVTYAKPTKRVFCTQDMSVLTSDLPTLLGVSSGIAILAGLICMVLHLFSKTKYPRTRSYADANIPPPIMYSTDTEIPLTVHSGRPSSRSSLRSSNSISSYSQRRPSSAPHSGSKGVLVSTSRSGSRRPSLASVHSTSSSIKSYSMQRIEKELQQKELRQEMKLRLARLQQSQAVHKPQIIIIGGSGGGGGGGGGGASTTTTTSLVSAASMGGNDNGINVNGNATQTLPIGNSSSSNSFGSAFGVGGTGVGGGGGGSRDYGLQQQQQQQQQQQHQYQLNHHHHHHGVSTGGGGASVGAGGVGAGGAVGGGGGIAIVGLHHPHHNQQHHQHHQQHHHQNASTHHHHVAFTVDPLMHQHVVLSRNNATAHTPSPLTPNSTDELLPSVDESQEFSPPQSVHDAEEGAYIGPCLSSDALLEK